MFLNNKDILLLKSDYMNIHKIYENAHNRQGLIQALYDTYKDCACILGAIILDNGHHGYGFFEGEIRDFDPGDVPYRNLKGNGGFNQGVFEDNNVIIIPIIGNYGLAAVLYLSKKSDPDTAKAAEIALKLHDEYRNAIERDPKLGTYNKNYVRGYDPRGRPYGLLMLDLDHFKKINDTYGHEAGDKVLEEFVKRLNEILPPEAIFARYGGEEFAVILPNADIRKLYELADRINRAVRNIEVPYEDTTIKATVSIGGGVYYHNFPIESAIKDADEKLYYSKEQGRNRATIGKKMYAN